MQVVTTVKTTMSEIKKALRLLNQDLPSEFVLEIDYNIESVDTAHSQDLVMWYDHVQSDGHNQDTTEQQSQHWYPDDSGEWIEIEMGRGKPEDLDSYQAIEVLSQYERSKKTWNSYPKLAYEWVFCDIVAYKLVKKGN